MSFLPKVKVEVAVAANQVDKVIGAITGAAKTGQTVEATMDKRRILELYLNVAEWGNGVFGAEAAARHYFGISAAQLSPEQAAWLAAILPAPQRYDRNRVAPWIARKAEIIYSRMPGAQIP